MKRQLLLALAAVLILGAMPASASGPDTEDYGDVTLIGGFQAAHFPEWWDLTAGDLILSFTYDATGLADDPGTHAWAELGVRSPCHGDFNPTWMDEGSGVWLATDYDWAANTFDPDPPGSPTLDIDDKMILQKAGGHGEGDYNLPSTPPNPGANHRIWFDRDGVDQWQGNPRIWPLSVDGGTYNTEGTYDIVITLHADNQTTGTAYMTINGLDQGFETDGNWKTMELSPAGMTFTGDMEHLRVFYGIHGYGATHTVVFEDISVEGQLTEPPLAPCFERSIDIKPCSDPNSINLKSKGKIPVAILSTDGFDATTVDPATVAFADADPLRWTVEDVCPFDGKDDLLFHFKTQELDLDETSTEATLTGHTFDGEFIWGTDTVNIVPKDK
jgi:hypothetical protein